MTTACSPDDDWYAEWRAICALAGVKAGRDGGVTLHDARRSSARNKRAAGIPASVVMSLHGWKTDAMLHRYDIVNAPIK